MNLEKVIDLVKSNYELINKSPDVYDDFNKDEDKDKDKEYRYNRPHTFEIALKLLIKSKNKTIFIDNLRNDKLLGPKFRYTKEGNHKMSYEKNFTDNDLLYLAELLYNEHKLYKIEINFS